MPTERDPDLTPEERRRQPSSAELRTREKLQDSRLGRLGRFRSWSTVLVGLVALGLCLLWLLRR